MATARKKKTAPLAEDAATEAVEEPKIAFHLVGETTALRHTVGGNEISLDEGETYSTNVPAEIAELDAHPNVERVSK